MVLDALLMELPVIGTNKGGTPEQLADGRGRVVAPRSPTELAGAIQYFIEHPEKAKQSGNMGNGWVKREHDWNNVIARFLRLYKNIFSNDQPI